MTGLTTEGQNASAGGVSDTFGWLALFNGDPDGAGTELSGGSPAYARKAVTWNTPAAGAVTASNVPITFDIPSGATVSHWAIYDASTAGNRGDSRAFSASEGPYGAQGEYEVTSVSLDPQAT